MGNCCPSEKSDLPTVAIKDTCNNMKCHTKCLSSCCISKSDNHHHHHKKHHKPDL